MTSTAIRHREVELPNGTAYEVHYCPPSYPARLFPGRCKHEPQFVMHADLRLVARKRGGSIIQVDHRVCLACGRSIDATHGGNVLVDLHMLWLRLGWHPEIGARVLALRDRWFRIATCLFDKKGWNGRHERVARLIDPHLTMKLRLRSLRRRRPRKLLRIGIVSFDRSYLRPAGAA